MRVLILFNNTYAVMLLANTGRPDFQSSSASS